MTVNGDELGLNILVTIPDGDFRNMVFDHENTLRLQEMGNITWNQKTIQYTQDELSHLLKTTDACIIGWHVPKITKQVVEDTPLKFIGYIGGSLKGVISRDIFDTYIKVVGCNRVFAKPLAEYTLMLLLMSFRKIFDYAIMMKKLKSSLTGPGNTMYEKTIGILGYGAIAAELIKLIKPFNPVILVCDEYCTEQTALQGGFTLVKMETLLAQSDAITIHHTLTDRTYHMIDRKALTVMKDNSIIVNTARGAIIDEKAMIEELSKGRLFAALDVYEKEPLPGDSPLRQLENVLIFPHIGGGTIESRKEMGSCIVKDLKRYQNGQELLNIETVEHYDRMTESIYFKEKHKRG